MSPAPEVPATDPFPSLDLRVGRSAELDPPARQQIHDLFAATYDEPNHAYIDRSMEAMRFVARALDGDTLLGFALSDARHEPLPRFETPQLLLLAGIGCVRPEQRRSGLFSEIARRAAFASGEIERATGRYLACGRMAHPAGFRSMRRIPTVIPREGVVVSDWHLEVAAAVAACYGVTLKPGSLVVQGSGRPIGTPRIEIDVAPEEWVPFRDVDRSRGDSLLGLAWAPDPPPGW